MNLTWTCKTPDLCMKLNFPAWLTLSSSLHLHLSAAEMVLASVAQSQTTGKYIEEGLSTKAGKMWNFPVVSKKSFIYDCSPDAGVHNCVSLFLPSHKNISFAEQRQFPSAILDCSTKTNYIFFIGN